jgi:hypothetical protein
MQSCRKITLLLLLLLLTNNGPCALRQIKLSKSCVELSSSSDGSIMHESLHRL